MSFSPIRHTTLFNHLVKKAAVKCPFRSSPLLKSTYLWVFPIIFIPEGQKVPLWSVPSKNEGCRNGVRVRVPHRRVDHCENPKLRQNRLQYRVRPINETWRVATCSIFFDSIDTFCTSTWLKKAGKFKLGTYTQLLRPCVGHQRKQS